MNTRSLGIRHSVSSDTSAHAHHPGRGSALAFAGHFLAMAAAMMLGMGAGSLLGISSVTNIELRATLWLLAMTVPMVAWMRFRGHSWRSSSEMTGAMIVPTLAACPLLWSGVISAAMFIRIEHVAMIPAMLALMVYRRREYGW